MVGANCLTVQLYDPFTTRASPAGGFIRDTFPGAVIPASRFDPVAATVIGYFPEPTSGGAPCTGINNFSPTRHLRLIRTKWT